MSEPNHCALPPEVEAGTVFDCDIYDCACGHMIGEHEYEWRDGRQVLLRCLECEAPTSRKVR